MKSQISSTETETEDEDMMPDLDRRSAVGAIEEEETLATSSDSLASLIPPEKKHSMQVRFLPASTFDAARRPPDVYTY